MKLLVAEYIRGLKERDELDVLLPLLLFSMDIVPISLPQIGTRQFGVDFAAVGRDYKNGQKTLFLFVLKKGDIGRADWSSNPQSVRDSILEIFDTYIYSQISVIHKKLPIKVVVAFSGIWKQEVTGWAGFEKNAPENVSLERWDANEIASLFEKFMLNEHAFTALDKQDIRQALALAGEVDLNPQSIFRLILRHLQLDSSGLEINSKGSGDKKAAVANFATALFSAWANAQGNSKNALFVAERTLLWTWHKYKNSRMSATASKSLDAAIRTYEDAGIAFLEKMKPNYYVKNGLCRSFTNNELYSIALFEQIGFLATLGLRSLECSDSESRQKEICEALINLLNNHSASSSPRMDEQVIEINLALLFLLKMDEVDFVINWVAKLATRLIYVFRFKTWIPANSFDELVSFSDDGNYEVGKEPFPNWLLATIADWALLLNQLDVYDDLAYGAQELYPWVVQQLWHPTSNVFDDFYFKNVLRSNGVAEAPINITNDPVLYARRIEKVLQTPELDVLSNSLARSRSMQYLDFIACRHFRNLVPPIIIYWEFHQRFTRGKKVMTKTSSVRRSGSNSSSVVEKSKNAVNG